MYYEDIDFNELNKHEKEIYSELKNTLDILEKKSVWDIINEYCIDIEYLVFDNEYGGVKLTLIDDLCLYICGDSSIETSNGKYWLCIHEDANLYNTILNTFELLYKIGVKKSNILSA